jgi:hypothetical protein
MLDQQARTEKVSQSINQLDIIITSSATHRDYILEQTSKEGEYELLNHQIKEQSELESIYTERFHDLISSVERLFVKINGRELDESPNVVSKRSSLVVIHTSTPTKIHFDSQQVT